MTQVWALRLEYDGTGFVGWQRQATGLSLQQVLEEAAAKLNKGAPVPSIIAGRTDAGVHAEGQVVAFDSPTLLPPKALKHLCDRVLPPDVRVLRVDPAPPAW